MSDDWENEDFEPTIPAGGVASDKWQGEDEDDDVKDNWEDEDDEEKKPEAAATVQTTAYQRPKKKPLAERIAEKERSKQAKDSEKIEEKVEMTPEQKLAEKIRLQKVQEEADLTLAKGLFGVGGIDGMYPETKDGFDQLEEALKTKITFFEASTLYSAFVEKLIHDVALTLPAEEIKKIGIALNSLYHEKERQRKEQAKNKKKKVKASIKVEKDDLGLADHSTGGAYYEDEEDFI